VVHDGPFEHTSTLKLIESTFGLPSLTARDANARNLGEALHHEPRRGVPDGTIPTSAQVPGPASDAAAVCSATSVQSVSPEPRHHGEHPATAPELFKSGVPTGSGMVGFGRQYKKRQDG
jgi:phospholipase C